MKLSLRVAVTSFLLVVSAGLTGAQQQPPGPGQTPGPNDRCNAQLTGVAAGHLAWSWNWSTTLAPVTVSGEIARVYGYDPQGNPLTSPNPSVTMSGPPSNTPNATSGTSPTINNYGLTTGDQYTSKIVMKRNGTVVTGNRSAVITCP